MEELMQNLGLVIFLITMILIFISTYKLLGGDKIYKIKEDDKND